MLSEKIRRRQDMNFRYSEIFLFAFWNLPLPGFSFTVWNLFQVKRAGQRAMFHSDSSSQISFSAFDGRLTNERVLSIFRHGF